MQPQAAIFCSIHLFALVSATLTSTPTVACPGDTVTFTCTLPGSFIRWTGTSSQGQDIFEISVDTSTSTIERGNPAFRGVFNDTSGGMATATLTSLSEASTVEGFMVVCAGESSREGPLTITVAAVPDPPLNPRVIFTLNQPSSSNITLDWDSPSSTGGVFVSYVLTISPIPISESPVTVETSSAHITVSYNTPYNVTISAVNCAGINETLFVDLMVCPTPSTAAMVTITNTPPVTVGGSMLTFTCIGDNKVRTSTCGNSGWSPDPGTYDCSPVTTVPPITCDSPAAPSRGSVDSSGRTPPFSIGSQVTYRCDEGLFPLDVGTSTCTDVEGRGEWVENPGILVCRETPVNCTVPFVPSNATILPIINGLVMNYERLSITVLEGTVLTYQCDNGLSLTGPNTITCTNAGVWNTDPVTTMCVLTNEGSTAATLSTEAAIAISVVITLIVAAILGFLTGLLVMHLCYRKKAVYSPAGKGQANVGLTAPVGPVYEEVSPKEKIELNTNQAYGPVGL